MRPKSLVLLSLALGCGLVAALGINQMMARQSTGGVVAGETVEVFVTLRDLNTNDLIKSEDIKVEAWPKDKLPPDVLVKLDDVKGRRARTKLFAGEPLRDAKLLASGDAGTGAADSIPAGFRVVSVRVDAVKSSGNLIKPGDRVDVIVHIQQASLGSSDPITKTFLQDVRVFAVNDLIDRPENGGAAKVVAQTISLLVKPDQVELVTLAEEMGKVRLSMRSPNDEETSDTAGAQPSNLLGSSGTPLRVEESPLPTAEVTSDNPLVNLLDRLKTGPPSGPLSAADLEKAPFKMTIIRGSEVEELEMDENGKVARGKTPAVEAEETEPQEN